MKNTGDQTNCLIYKTTKATSPEQILFETAPPYTKENKKVEERIYLVSLNKSESY